MEQLGIVLALLACIGLIAFIVRFGPKLLERTSVASGAYSYKKSESLLTPAERSFFGVLLPIADALELHVFVKVRLGDVLWVPRGTAQQVSFRNQIQQKHLDFVLCDRKNLAPRLAIELDDASHRSADRQARDAFVEQACQAAEFPLLRVVVKRGYDAKTLDGRIRALLNPTTLGDPLAVPEGVPSETEPVPDTVVAQADSATEAESDGPTCPKCGARLVERSKRATGDRFLGCSNFPNCRYTEALDTPTRSGTPA